MMQVLMKIFNKDQFDVKLKVTRSDNIRGDFIFSSTSSLVTFCHPPDSYEEKLLPSAK